MSQRETKSILKCVVQHKPLNGIKMILFVLCELRTINNIELH